MSDDSAEIQAAPDEAPEPPRKRRRWPGIVFLVLVVLPLTVFAVWALIALNWTYSRGYRSGYVQKFSHKGWVCKTWEGELSMVNIPGQAQERWFFTVRNDSIASVLRASMGDRVTLEYEEHPGVPTTCFGETRYYVVGVRPAASP